MSFCFFRIRCWCLFITSNTHSLFFSIASSLSFFFLFIFFYHLLFFVFTHHYCLFFSINPLLIFLVFLFQLAATVHNTHIIFSPTVPHFSFLHAPPPPSVHPGMHDEGHATSQALINFYIEILHCNLRSLRARGGVRWSRIPECINYIPETVTSLHVSLMLLLNAPVSLAGEGRFVDLLLPG